MAKTANKTNNMPPCSVCGSHLVDLEFQIITRVLDHRAYTFHVCTPCQSKKSQRSLDRTLKRRVTPPFKIEIPPVVVQTAQSEPVMMEK
ncbi:MAG: hypothetical protein ACW976_06860 [Candidatus Ranarchaeia archaeon]|jgi:hypothetical protein